MVGNVNDVSFDAIRQRDRFDNTLTYRGVVKASGLTYDYMDKLNNFVKQGIFVDEKGDGFTSAEKRALMEEFTKIHLEKGYSTQFSTMLPGTTFEYDYNDFIRMAQAAGYVLKEEPVVEAPEEKNDAPEALPKEEKVETDPQTDGERTAATQKSAEALMFEQLEADPEFAGKTGEERLQAIKDRQSDIRQQLSDLKKPATYKTKKFLFWGGKEKTRELTPEEAQERERLNLELNAELDELNKQQEFVQNMEGKFWVGRCSPDAVRDSEGHIIEDIPSYNRVTLVDEEGNERRAAEVVFYDKRDEYGYLIEERKYYSLDVKKVGTPSSTQGQYWELVPDMNNELKGYKPKNYTP